MSIKCRDCEEQIYSVSEIVDEIHSMPKEWQDLMLSAKIQPVLNRWIWVNGKLEIENVR